MTRGDRYLLLAFARIILFVAAILLAIGCERTNELKPPEILFVQQECDECRMIISDERYAAALVVGDGGGERSAVFDDIGCLLQYLEDHGQEHVAALFVRDQSTRQWLDAESATYVHSELIETPMAFGLAAFASPQQAAELKETLAERAEILAWSVVRDRFCAEPFTAGFRTTGGQP